MKIGSSEEVSSISGLTSFDESCCWSSNTTAEIQITANSVAKSSILILITLSIIFSNLVFIFTLNSQHYSKLSSQHPQFRYLLTCLAINDFFIGIFVIALGITPAFLQCWPFGEILCQIQASLREVLPRQSVVILMCTSIDRYLSMRYPGINEKCCINKICILTISLSLIMLFFIFITLVMSRQGYYFNDSGLMGCDIHYIRPSFRILSACMFYFPATMLFMYCYGSLYHFRHKKYSLTSLRNFNLKSARHSLKCDVDEKPKKIIGRKMGLISLMFIITSTPWFINEMIVAGTGYKVSSIFDFLFTYIALSNSFWNPFLYWVLDDAFRISFFSLLKKTDENEERKSCTNYCNNYNNPMHVLDISILDTCQKHPKNDILTIKISGYPNCPTPPPPPKVIQISAN